MFDDTEVTCSILSGLLTYGCSWSVGQSVISLVGWEINVLFQHKNMLYLGQGLGCRFSPSRLRMASDTVTSTVTSRSRCPFVQRRPKMGKDRGGSFKLLCLQQGGNWPTTTRAIYQFSV